MLGVAGRKIGRKLSLDEKRKKRERRKRGQVGQYRLLKRGGK